MSQSRSKHNNYTVLALIALLSLTWSSCDSTKHLKEGEYLLRSNTVKLKTDVPVKHKSDLRDNLSRIIAQKPNTYAVFGYWPTKVWLYNLRYKKYEKDTANFQIRSKTVEKPVVYDSTSLRRSVQNMKSYMFNQGFFYAHVTDTTKFKGKKAYVTYNVETGTNYAINKVNLDVDDSTVAGIIHRSSRESVLVIGEDFSMNQLEAERSRITNLLKDNGYYKFSQESINFVIDTVNKAALQNAENIFAGAMSVLEQKKKDQKPPLEVNIIIRAEDPSEYRKYYINRITVVPDYSDRRDLRDSTMIVKNIDNVTFRYRNYYVRSRVILKHIYLEKGRLFSQSDYEQTQTKLTELGVFRSINIRFREDTSADNLLNCTILMNRNKKFDFGTSYEVSSGSTYFLGNTLSFSVRDKNLGKGANLLSLSVSGGLETAYDQSRSTDFFSRFSLLNRYYGVNASINFPKFIVPFAVNGSRRNLPRTIINVGTNFQDRINYFTLTNTTASLIYNFRETREKTWDISPAFVNIIRLPHIADSFQARLNTNEFLRNSYRPTFIEGENIAYTFTDQEKKKGRSYSYLRLAFEEAGGVMKGITALIPAVDSSYSQYLKFDFDAHHYFKRRHSTVAVRFYGGIGLPYDHSTTLPYIKQYYGGGAYSIRGWRIRQLGPGSYFDASTLNNTNSFIDRTGDIKLEMNGEYRFDILQLFTGAIKFNGALFADAGNIWLARASADYPGGEFSFSTLGQDIAVASGAGIRMDIAGFFVIRVDGAIPVKKPYIFNGNGGWVFNEFAFNNPTWRSNNIILNIAIGYPF
ncbi:MAG: BamA/TamA family outer membrane protein [Bacteroidetes bacterium]|nr:BamA/TamA family outer membrane protein [Bacteroidota bacterium]